jgi:hypothetical protein
MASVKLISEDEATGKVVVRDPNRVVISSRSATEPLPSSEQPVSLTTFTG